MAQYLTKQRWNSFSERSSCVWVQVYDGSRKLYHIPNPCRGSTTEHKHYWFWRATWVWESFQRPGSHFERSRTSHDGRLDWQRFSYPTNKLGSHCAASASKLPKKSRSRLSAFSILLRLLRRFKILETVKHINEADTFLFPVALCDIATVDKKFSLSYKSLAASENQFNAPAQEKSRKIWPGEKILRNVTSIWVERVEGRHSRLALAQAGSLYRVQLKGDSNRYWHCVGSRCIFIGAHVPGPVRVDC